MTRWVLIPVASLLLGTSGCGDPPAPPRATRQPVVDGAATRRAPGARAPRPRPRPRPWRVEERGLVVDSVLFDRVRPQAWVREIRLTGGCRYAEIMEGMNHHCQPARLGIAAVDTLRDLRTGKVLARAEVPARYANRFRVHREWTWPPPDQRPFTAIRDLQAGRRIRWLAPSRSLLILGADERVRTRFQLPPGCRMRYARFVPDGSKVLVAYIIKTAGHKAMARLELRGADSGALLSALRFAYRLKFFRRPLLGGMARYVYGACRQGHQRLCEMAKRFVRYAHNLPRDRELSATMDRAGKRIALAVFGDLYLVARQGDALRRDQRWRDAFYLSAEWWIRRPQVALSPDGRRLAYYGTQGLVRFLRLPSRAFEDTKDKSANHWDSLRHPATTRYLFDEARPTRFWRSGPSARLIATDLDTHRETTYCISRLGLHAQGKTIPKPCARVRRYHRAVHLHSNSRYLAIHADHRLLVVRAEGLQLVGALGRASE